MNKVKCCEFELCGAPCEVIKETDEFIIYQCTKCSWMAKIPKKLIEEENKK